MNYLVDAHIFLWSLFSPGLIPKKIKAILSEPEAVKFISAISFWEIAIKFSLGKLDLKGILPDILPTIAKNAGFEILDLNTETVASFYKLPKLTNKDPFDRMLVWQAINSNYYLLTKDKGFEGYTNYGLRIV